MGMHTKAVFSSFSLDMRHTYRINGQRLMFVYATNGVVTFASPDNKRDQINYDFAVLNRMNAQGHLEIEPYGELPDEQRPRSPDEDELISTVCLSAAGQKRLNTKYALVRSFLELQSRGETKATDESIAANMDRICLNARDYLEEDLVNPAYATKLENHRAGLGPKPRSKGTATIPSAVSPRTLRNYLSAYRRGGKAALFDGYAKSGDRSSYFSTDELTLLIKVVEENYLTLQRKSIKAVFEDLKIAFADENSVRKDKGHPELRRPSKEKLRLYIASLSKFRVRVARHGLEQALNWMRLSSEGPEALRPMQGVEMDEWKIDLLSLLTMSGLIKLFTEQELIELGLKSAKDRETIRWWVTAAIDRRTRCILGLVLSANPKSSAAKKCLGMIVSDKGQYADKVGAMAPWSMMGRPEVLFVDNGPAFKSISFTNACSELGISKVQTIAGCASMRGTIERVFKTMSTTLLSRLSGRTFGDTITRKGHPSEKRACLSVDDFAEALVRWVVDVYHNEPHEGLLGRTPLQQWEADLEDGNFPLMTLPQRRQKRVALGTSLIRSVQKNGLKILNVRYNDGSLGAWYQRNKKQEVEVRWIEEDLGSIEVFFDGKWNEVSAVSSAVKGIDANTWMATLRTLRSRSKARKEWEETTVSRAIRDIEALNAKRQQAYGIFDFQWTNDRLERAEAEARGTFEIVQERVRTDVADDGLGEVIKPKNPKSDEKAKSSRGEKARKRTEHDRTFGFDDFDK